MSGESPEPSHQTGQAIKELEIYEDRLCKLSLTTLAKRRLRGDLIKTYKIITGKKKTKKGELLRTISDTGYNLRGHCYKLATQRSHLEVRRNFFSQRMSLE